MADMPPLPPPRAPLPQPRTPIPTLVHPSATSYLQFPTRPVATNIFVETNSSPPSTDALLFDRDPTSATASSPSTLTTSIHPFSHGESYNETPSKRGGDEAPIYYKGLATSSRPNDSNVGLVKLTVFHFRSNGVFWVRYRFRVNVGCFTKGWFAVGSIISRWRCVNGGRSTEMSHIQI